MKVNKDEFLRNLETCVWSSLDLPFPPVWAEKVRDGKYRVTYSLEQLFELVGIRCWDERYYVCFYLPSPRPNWEKRIRISKRSFGEIKDKIQFQVTIEEVYTSIFPMYCVTSVRAFLSEREHS